MGKLRGRPLRRCLGVAAGAGRVDSLAGTVGILTGPELHRGQRICGAQDLRRARADVVRWFRADMVAEQGRRWACGAPFAGVGAWWMTRRKSWDLAGYEANRHAINRETQRLIAIRSDHG